ncbi:MAG: hypothetical protein ACT4RN_16285, partial [Pseudonocardia sp.]
GDLLPIGLSQHRALRAHPVLLVGSMSPTIYTKINCFHRLGSRGPDVDGFHVANTRGFCFTNAYVPKVYDADVSISVRIVELASTDSFGLGFRGRCRLHIGGDKRWEVTCDVYGELDKVIATGKVSGDPSGRIRVRMEDARIEFFLNDVKLGHIVDPGDEREPAHVKIIVDAAKSHVVYSDLVIRTL